MKVGYTFFLGLVIGFGGLSFTGAEESFIRVNQLGYRPGAVKIAVSFGHSNAPAEFSVVSTDNKSVVFKKSIEPIRDAKWGRFGQHYELNFSAFHLPGKYLLQLGDSQSLPFVIDEDAYRVLPGQLLEFMRQQRCGYNPWLDEVCHPYDGRSAYGPLTNGTYVDARGGWHDAGDLLKYMLTSGNATAQMLLAYELARQNHKPAGPAHNGLGVDLVNSTGQKGSNGIPDVLDEAKWGLEWMLKMHPGPAELYHQVADDRDHAGWRLPQNESVNYGWGKGNARVVYFADGRPQGLQQYKSASTGVANLAGRYAAAMGLANQVWKEDPAQRPFAERCLRAGMEVYAIGRRLEGVQQGNSYGAPYRYEESTWADDMEWGAAELYRCTRERSYLEEAKRYARIAAAESWMGKEQTGHYQYYPFMNPGHFRLFDLVDRKFKAELAGYYRDGIERCSRAGRSNPYRVGVPFIWCSNNLVAALVTQCLLYERMTGDSSYHGFAARQRDWLLGRNPWGYTMFTQVGTLYPKAPHLMTTQLTRRSVAGGLVDGPVYERIFKSLKGVSITEPDPLAPFQGPAVYHDDVQDYSSNEPTMDGTASAILMTVLCNSEIP